MILKNAPASGSVFFLHFDTFKLLDNSFFKLYNL